MNETPTANDETPPDGVDPKLLELLVCPQSKSRLICDRENQELISPAARLAYPIREGVPIMLAEEARGLSDAEALRYRA